VLGALRARRWKLGLPSGAGVAPGVQTCGALLLLLRDDLRGLPLERKMTGCEAVRAGPGGRAGKFAAKVRLDCGQKRGEKAGYQTQR
jgi:hypothetical protein